MANLAVTNVTPLPIPKIGYLHIIFLEALPLEVLLALATG
jgi:hypothetical protein